MEAISLLRTLGMRPTYAGYDYLAYAITLVSKDRAYLKSVTKNLYNVIGHKYGVTNICVEASLRTLITSYWNQHADTILTSLLGYPLYDKPTSSELIIILSDYLREHQNITFH
ncbi:MAG: hypothetical protein HFG41_07620 [Coprococcus sp.]|nr:hypothetical protein [Coprococcus sp.]